MAHQTVAHQLVATKKTQGGTLNLSKLARLLIEYNSKFYDTFKNQLYDILNCSFIQVDPIPHSFNSVTSPTPPPPSHTQELKMFCNAKFMGVLLKVENYHFFLPIYPKIGWLQQVGYYFPVDHNLLTFDHDLPCSPCHFFHLIYHMIGRS